MVALAWKGGGGCLVLLILLTTVTESEAGAGIRLCGKKLFDTVTKLCRGCTVGGFEEQREQMTKRDRAREWLVGIDTMEGRAEDDETEDALASLAARWLAAVEPSRERLHKRGGGGIVERCCKGKCNYRYLKSFCSTDCPEK